MAREREGEDTLNIFKFGRVGDAGACAHYDDPAYYSKTYGDRHHDVDYYVRLARESAGPVLEYGVGNGRIGHKIARAGIELCGVDLSEPMLADFRRKLEHEPKHLRKLVSLVAGDMREVRLERRFPLIIAPFNCVLHLYTRRDVESFFARVKEHLAPAGRFVFDFSLPQPADLSRDPERKFGAPKLRHPTTGELVRYTERFEYDPLRQLLLTVIEFTPENTGKSWSVPLTHRQFFPREMEALLHYNGFTEVFFTADFTDEAADASVDSLVASCRIL